MAMKATDLMVGDYIRMGGVVRKVTGIYGDGRDKPQDMMLNTIIPALNFPDGNLSFRAEYAYPIPLSAEMLEENGFKKFNFHDIEGQHQWTWWLDTLTNVSLWTRELKDDPKDGWMVRVESPLASCCLKIEHVHELQHVLQLHAIDKEIELR